MTDRSGASARRVPADASATTVFLAEADATSVETIAAALPDPSTLSSGALVVVHGTIRSPRSLARSVLAVFGKSKGVDRAARCSALVARGYVDVGAGEDAERADVAWGRAPGIAAER